MTREVMLRILREYIDKKKLQTADTHPSDHEFVPDEFGDRCEKCGWFDPAFTTPCPDCEDLHRTLALKSMKEAQIAFDAINAMGDDVFQALSRFLSARTEVHVFVSSRMLREFAYTPEGEADQPTAAADAESILEAPDHVDPDSKTEPG